MRIAARTDTNQKELTREFEKLGCSVGDLHRVGKGMTDLVVGVGSIGTERGVNWLVEVKYQDGTETDDQIRFRGAWRGPRAIARTVDDVERIVKTMRRQAFLIAMGHT